MSLKIKDVSTRPHPHYTGRSADPITAAAAVHSGNRSWDNLYAGDRMGESYIKKPGLAALIAGVASAALYGTGRTVSLRGYSFSFPVAEGILAGGSEMIGQFFSNLLKAKTNLLQYQHASKAESFLVPGLFTFGASMLSTKVARVDFTGLPGGYWGNSGMMFAAGGFASTLPDMWNM